MLALNNGGIREQIFALEDMMRQMPQVKIPVKHYFSFGVYAREIYIPKGACFTGEIHKYQNLNILSKGDISVLIDNEIKRIQAPFTFVAETGSKRVFYAHEDCVWTTIHGTHEKDLEIIEQVFIAKSEQEFLEFIGDNQLRLAV